VPKIKAVQDDFNRFKSDQDKSAAEKMRSAKTDSDRNAVLKDYQKSLDDKQNSSIKPVVDQTREAIAGVAKKKGLLRLTSQSLCSRTIGHGFR